MYFYTIKKSVGDGDGLLGIELLYKKIESNGWIIALGITILMVAQCDT